jgi:hypothetical protein
MEKKEIFNYISTENNAKIEFCSSKKENIKCINILSDNEKVRIYFFNNIKYY